MRLPRSVHSFAAATALHRRTLERHLARVGIQGAKRLLDAARLTRAWAPLSQRTFSMTQVAARAGFSSPRTLDRSFHEHLGMSPSHAARDLYSSTFAELVALSCVRQAPLSG